MTDFQCVKFVILAWVCGLVSGGLIVAVAWGAWNESTKRVHGLIYDRGKCKLCGRGGEV